MIPQQPFKPQVQQVQQQPFQPQVQQVPFTPQNPSYITDFQTSATGQLGLQLGTQAFSTAQQRVDTDVAYITEADEIVKQKE